MPITALGKLHTSSAEVIDIQVVFPCQGVI